MIYSSTRDVKCQSICCQELVGLYILYKHTVQTRLIQLRLLVCGTSRPTRPYPYGCGELHHPSQDILCTDRTIFPALVSPERRPSALGGPYIMNHSQRPLTPLQPALLLQALGDPPGPAPHVHGISAPELGCPTHSALIRPYPPPSCWRLDLGTKWSIASQLNGLNHSAVL